MNNNSNNREDAMMMVLENIHVKCCKFVRQSTSPVVRHSIEWVLFLLGVTSMMVLVASHRTFLNGAIPKNCLSSLIGFDPWADVTHVILHDNGPSFVSASAAFANQTSVYLSYSTEESWARPPRLYSGVTEQYITISKDYQPCFGGSLWLVNFLGTQTIVSNWLLATFGDGFSYKDGLLTTLSVPPYTRLHWLVYKVIVVLKTSFLFFITTTLAHFTMMETQAKMLDFRASLISLRDDNNWSIARLVCNHVIEISVFVSITVGIYFFLSELYSNDRLFAFLILSLVWACEAFAVVSLRTPEGRHFFPRFFFVLFAANHFYHFSFPHTFTYLGFLTTVIWIVYLMVVFWNHYELPAVFRTDSRLEQRPRRLVY